MTHTHDWMTGNHAFQCSCGAWEGDPFGPRGGCDCHAYPAPTDPDLMGDLAYEQMVRGLVGRTHPHVWVRWEAWESWSWSPLPGSYLYVCDVPDCWAAEVREEPRSVRTPKGPSRDAAQAHHTQPVLPPPDLDLIDDNGVRPWRQGLADALINVAVFLIAVVMPGGGGVGGGRGKGGPPPPPPPDKG